MSVTRQEVAEVEFFVDSTAVVFQVQATEVHESPHTRRPLRRLSVDGLADASTEPAVAKMLRRGSGRGAVLVDVSGGRWHVAGHITSRTSGSDAILFSATLEEQEEVLAQRLEFGGLSFRPDRYLEEVEDDAIIITARARLNPVDVELLRALERQSIKTEDEHHYFEVVRVGVEPNPREMRLGRLLWQQLVGTSDVEYQVVLVERPYDRLKRPKGMEQIAQPYLSRAIRQIAAQASLMESLLRLLVERQLLTDREVSLLQEGNVDAFPARAFLFSEVRNLDDWEIS